jgi:hypothetical protein
MSTKIKTKSILLTYVCPSCNQVYRQPLNDIVNCGTLGCIACGDIDCNLDEQVDLLDTPEHETCAQMAEEYINQRGMHCPWCKSLDIQTGELNQGATEIYQNVSCDKCGKEWTDCYTLTGVTLEE